MPEMTDYAIVPETPASETISLGTTAKPAKEVVLTGDVRNASGEGASASEIETAVEHAAATGNPHGADAEDVGAEPANANIQAHVAGTGSPHTAAGVGAEPAAGNPATSGFVFSSTDAGVRSWVQRVVGPASSTSGNLAQFNGTTGAAIADGPAYGTSGASVLLRLGAGGTADPSVLPAATTSAAGSMSAADFARVNVGTTAGDMFYAASASAWAKLAISTLGYGMRVGGASTLPVWMEPWNYFFTAASMDSAGIASGAVTVLATTEVDPTSAFLTVVAFDATTAEGKFVGPIRVPAGATGVTLSPKWRAASSPGSSKGVVWKVFACTMDGTEATSAFDAGTALTAQTTADATWVAGSQRFTLETLGANWAAGGCIMIQWSRLPTDESDDLAVDAKLLSIGILFD